MSPEEPQPSQPAAAPQPPQDNIPQPQQYQPTPVSGPTPKTHKKLLASIAILVVLVLIGLLLHFTLGRHNNAATVENQVNKSIQKDNRSMAVINAATALDNDAATIGVDISDPSVNPLYSANANPQNMQKDCDQLNTDLGKDKNLTSDSKAQTDAFKKVLADGQPVYEDCNAAIQAQMSIDSTQKLQADILTLQKAIENMPK